MTVRFDILTIFPEFFTSIFQHGVVKRAAANGLVTITAHDLRGFTRDRHRTVDDRPFGGGEGMVLKPEPIAEALASLAVTPKADRQNESIILLSAQGAPFTQGIARELSQLDRVVLICGRYEGVDERVNELFCDRELSIGDFVLSGGELGAAVIVDATMRLLPGVLGNEASSEYEPLLQKFPKPTTAHSPAPSTAPEGCSIIRTTPGPRNFRVWPSRRSSLAATMTRSVAGVAKRRSKKRFATARTCSQ
jgi:tRNA (guanine-N1)-methyltransferase